MMSAALDGLYRVFGVQVREAAWYQLQSQLGQHSTAELPMCVKSAARLVTMKASRNPCQYPAVTAGKEWILVLHKVVW
jgi:hypothetical protein